MSLPNLSNRYCLPLWPLHPAEEISIACVDVFHGLKRYKGRLFAGVLLAIQQDHQSKYFENVFRVDIEKGAPVHLNQSINAYLGCGQHLVARDLSEETGLVGRAVHFCDHFEATRHITPKETQMIEDLLMASLEEESLHPVYCLRVQESSYMVIVDARGGALFLDPERAERIRVRPNSTSASLSRKVEHLKGRLPGEAFGRERTHLTNEERKAITDLFAHLRTRFMEEVAPQLADPMIFNEGPPVSFLKGSEAELTRRTREVLWAHDFWQASAREEASEIMVYYFSLFPEEAKRPPKKNPEGYYVSLYYGNTSVGFDPMELSFLSFKSGPVSRLRLSLDLVQKENLFTGYQWSPTFGGPLDRYSGNQRTRRVLMVSAPAPSAHEKLEACLSYKQ